MTPISIHVAVLVIAILCPLAMLYWYQRCHHRQQTLLITALRNFRTGELTDDLEVSQHWQVLAREIFDTCLALHKKIEDLEQADKLTEHKIGAEVESLYTLLHDLNQSQYPANIALQEDNPPWTTLKRSIIELVSSLQKSKIAHAERCDKRFTDYAGRTGKDLRNLVEVQSILIELTENIAQAFDAATQADANVPASVITSIGRAVNVLEDIRLLLDKDDLSTCRRFSIETLKHYSKSVERIVSTISHQKSFDIHVDIADEISNTKALVTVDMHATMRFLALVFEYLPQRLQTFEAPWRLTMSIERGMMEPPSVKFELAINHTVSKAMQRQMRDEIESDRINQSILRTQIEKIKKMKTLYHIKESITFDEPHIRVAYEFDFICHDSEEALKSAFEQKYGSRRYMLCVGDQDFLLFAGQRLDALFIDHKQVTLEALEIVTETFLENIGLVIIDYHYQHDTVKQISGLVKQHSKFRHIPCVAVLNTRLYGEEAHAMANQLGVDQVIAHPLRPSDIVALANQMDSSQIITRKVESLNDKKR